MSWVIFVLLNLRSSCSAVRQWLSTSADTHGQTYYQSAYAGADPSVRGAGEDYPGLDDLTGSPLNCNQGWPIASQLLFAALQLLQCSPDQVLLQLAR